MERIQSYIHVTKRFISCVYNQPRSELDFEAGSMAGKLALVTGGQKGIGEYISLALAKAGADVIVAGRSKPSGELAALSNVHYIQLDLSDLRSVDAFSKAVHAQFPARPLDMLINNAGIGGVPYGRSAQGHELHFATNVLGHFRLTHQLMDMLTAVSDQSKGQRKARVVILTGDIYMFANDCTPDYTYGGVPCLNGTAGMAYNRSKLGNLWFAFQLAKRHAHTLNVVAVHPGVIYTGLFEGNKKRGKLGFQLTTKQGAYMPLKCATAASAKNGAYYHNVFDDGRDEPLKAFVLPSYDRALDVKRQEEFWEECVELSRV